MSAICGIFYCNGRPVTPETGAGMMRELGIYYTDAAGTWQERNLFLGCHAQHITPESVGEILPYHDVEAGLTITADAIIDNRAELCDMFGVEQSQQGELPDSLLIMMAYRKWGQNCPQYLVGDFAFVIWNEKRQELFCAVDPTGIRAFYYYHSAGLFAFSTLIKPLFVLPGIDKEYNETWIADFLAIPSVMHQLDPELTLYQNIFLLPAGHTLKVCSDGVIKQVYWRVERQPELKMKSDLEYEEAFRDVLGEAVRCRLRSIRPVGVMMSGGLDSTSVACIAAQELAGRGQRLPVFSAVPVSGYRNWLPASRMADETPYIEAVREQFANIDVTYCRSEGLHPLSDTNRLLAMLEQPYKIFENLFWLDGIMAAAQEQNIGVILTGGAGNYTISWGDSDTYLLSLLRAGQFYRLFRESWAVAWRKHRRPLIMLKKLVKPLLPFGLQKRLNIRNQRYMYMKSLDLSPINQDFARRMTVQERLRRYGHDPSYRELLDSFETRQKFLSPAAFSHFGVITTKQSMAYRMASRDPTMDKRVIEFCLSVPESQYVRDGQGRFLIRRAMVGILPNKVRLSSIHGVQSADWTQRLQFCWPELACEISNIGALEAERKFLDLTRIRRELGKFSTLSDDAAKDFNLRMLMRSLIFSRFLRMNG